MPTLHFNPDCRAQVQPVYDAHKVLVLDNVFQDPELLVAGAAAFGKDFVPPPAKLNYPGLIRDVLDDATRQSAGDFIREKVLPVFGMQPVSMELLANLSLATFKPAELTWKQRMCHQDHHGDDRGRSSLAGVCYLFRDERLGGTGFYRFRPGKDYRNVLGKYLRGSPELKAVIRETFPYFDSEPAYITGSNEFAQLVGSVPAAWNRMIFYRTNLPHSPHILHPELLSADPTRGRLTLNFIISTPGE